jgi:chromosomal replication initiator protein
MQSTITDESSHTKASGHVLQNTTDGNLSLIDSINKVLADKVGAQKFRIWFQNSARMSLSNGYLKIAVPNLFIAGWIENHFSSEINHAVRTVTGAEAKVTFTIDPKLSGHQRRTHLDTKNSTLAVLPRKSKTTTPAHKSKKLKMSLDTFVVGQSNELAYNAAKAVVNEQQSPFNPLFIHGGYGLGKTHLLQGICNAVCKRRPQTNWLYLSAEDFVNQFVLALKTKKLEAFRRRMRQTDLLAIDDIHFLASKSSTQEEFLHTFNTISLAGKQVVMVSDAHPKMIGQLSEKLVNRFISGMVVKIDVPDLQTRCQICQQFFLKTQNLKLKIKNCDGVIRYIAENLRTNVRELEGALLKVIAFSALKNEGISLPLVKAVLSEHLERCDPIVHVSDIESVVASYFGITSASIHSSKKDRTVALARRFCMYLIRKHTKMSSSEVGRFLGNKNHATVLLACKKIEDLVKRNAELRWHGPAGNKICKAKTILTNLEAAL